MPKDVATVAKHADKIIANYEKFWKECIAEEKRVSAEITKFVKGKISKDDLAACRAPLAKIYKKSGDHNKAVYAQLDEAEKMAKGASGDDAKKLDDVIEKLKNARRRINLNFEDMLVFMKDLEKTVKK